MIGDKTKMTQQNKKQLLLKQIPGIDTLVLHLENEHQDDTVPKSVALSSTRSTIETLRKEILESPETFDEQRLLMDNITKAILKNIKKKLTFNLRRTINATGVVVHTNLGRSLLSESAIANIATISGGYSNLELDLATGKRGLRYTAVESLICELTGAEAAMVVNNNAAAVLLCLESLAKGKEVIVSRGELVEIGGSFRIPDVMEKSGGILREVGTTNRTHLKDYVSAIGENTALLLKVHTSNYSVVGFTSAVSISELAATGKKNNIPVMDDLGSGTLIDLSRYGLTREPTVQDSINAGADVVTFSGDKLLGGPQAGIIAGKRELIHRIRQNPLTRALRIDKMTLAALESTLRAYRDETKALQDIPTLRMLTMTYDEIKIRAVKLAEMLDQIAPEGLEHTLLDLSSKAGGGSLPLLELPSCCIGLKLGKMSVNALEKKMRARNPAIMGRIENDLFIIDPRTLQDDEPELICRALVETAAQATEEQKG
jgi:L-seryl-tRNA(Ser) seleniumtransferase